MNAKPARGFWSLCPSEPFRIFFPMGLLIGISGVSLWPLYFMGIHKFYPGIMHGRMMIQGFLMAFVIGFLGTAFPRLSGSAPLSRLELWTLITLLAAVTGVQIGLQPLIADCLFLVLLGVFVSLLARRFQRRTEFLPASFVLVLMGFASAIIGTALLVSSAWSPGSVALPFLGNSLLYQAFILFLLMGVGGFLIPRFLGLKVEDDKAPRSWSREAVIAGGIGVMILSTYAAEAWSGDLRTWGLLRAFLATAYLISQVPLHRSHSARTTLAQSLRVGFLILLAGLFLPALLPGQRIAALHLVFRWRLYRDHVLRGHAGGAGT